MNPVCVICNVECENEYGNNPLPLFKKIEGGRCCDQCNISIIIPARIMKQIENNKKPQAHLIKYLKTVN